MREACVQLESKRFVLVEEVRIICECEWLQLGGLWHELYFEHVAYNAYLRQPVSRYPRQAS